MKPLRFLQIAFLILLAAGAQPAYSAFWQWSKTAATNAGADPTINWAEGMSPSSINDSARAMMARAAEFRDDISGLLTTGGSSTAYTLATNQGLPSTPNDGQLISFTVHATNGAAATLQADSGTAFPIQSSTGVPVAAASLILGTPYNAKFSSANSAWMLKGFYGSALTVPLGGMVPYTLSTVPNSNFVFPAGQCLSTTTYATYWVALGSPASGTCAGGQFRIIDLSGRAPVGLDTMPGFAAANRLTSSSVGCGTAMTSVGATCATGNESQTLLLSQIPAHNHGGATGTMSANASHLHTYSLITGNPTGGTGYASGNPGYGTGVTTNTSSTNTDHTHSIASAGGGGAFSVMIPVVGVTYLLRVL